MQTLRTKVKTKTPQNVIPVRELILHFLRQSNIIGLDAIEIDIQTDLQEDITLKTKQQKKYWQSMAVIAAITALAMTLTSCGNQTTTQTQTTTAATTQATTTAATTTPAATTAPVNPVEQSFQAKIDAYLTDLPAEQPGTAAAADEQAKLVEQMTQLYTNKASSKDFYTLYLKGITQLSPDNADTFTALAISGMRRNSFQDYTVIEKNYTKDATFLERFLAEAKIKSYNYLKFSHDPAAITDAKVKELVNLATTQGYYVASSEGMLYYLVDFSVFAKYRNYNTKPMAALIETLAIDALDPVASDAAFLIDHSTLAARAWNIEQKLKDYQGTRFEKYMAVRFRDQMTLVFYGVNNTPTYSYETRKFTDESQAVFNDVQTLEGTQMAKLVTSFTALVAANDGKLDEATQKKADTILDTINTTYHLTDEAMKEYGDWMSGELSVS